MDPVPAAPATPAPDDRKRLRKLLLRLVGSALLLAALVAFVPWHLLADAFARVSPMTFLATLALFLGCHAFGSLKWRMVIATAGARLPVRDAFRCYAAGLFSNIFLPSIVGGDVLRALLAGKKSGRLEAAILGGAADRVLDLAAIGSLALGASFFVGLAQDGAQRTLLLVGAGLALVGGLAGAALLLRRPLAKWPAKLRRRIAQALIALRRQSRRPGVLAFSFLGALAMQAALVGLNALLAGGLELHAGPTAWLFAWSLAKLAGLAPIGFNGIGVRDGAFAFLMVPLLAADGLSREELLARALAASLLWQALLVVGSLLAGGVWALLKRGVAADSAPRTESLQHG